MLESGRGQSLSEDKRRPSMAIPQFLDMKRKHWAVIVAQLVEWLLLIREVRSSNPFIIKISQ